MALKFASTDHLEFHEDLARDFLSRILEMPYEASFISDESTLSDFTGCPLAIDAEPASAWLDWDTALLSSIEREYGIAAEVDMQLVRLFDLIAEATHQTRH